MKRLLFRILETNELKQLGLKNIHGMDWFPPILKRKYLQKNEAGDYIITQKDYDTVKQYIVDYFITEEELIGISVEFDLSETDIRNRVHEAISDQEIEQHHVITRTILSDIRDEEIARYSQKIVGL